MEDVVEFTKRLKEQEGSKIWMVGGGSLLREFFRNNLIDEYVVTITPHILGSEFRYLKKRTRKLI